jgi:cellulose synthase/poly-beta-1,6-N-acetylglucosamine synthase-like glycosyltransferase
MPVETVITHILLFISLYFEVFLLLTFLERKKDVTVITKEPKYFPSVTVIVPCFNEEKTVGKTIESLLALNYPKEKLKLMLVDDGSTDSTWQALKKFENNQNITIHKKENGGKFTALNYALGHVTTELVGCLDADSFVDQNALNNIVTRFENKKTMAVTPNIQVHNPKNLIELIQKAEYTLSVFIRRVFAFLGSVYITPGPFSIFRREVFENLGPYKHAHNTEDLEMALRMQVNHYAIDNAHDAIVYTVAPRTLPALFQQRLRWIHGFLENAIDYRELFFKRGYGNLSFFIFPLAAFSIFSALYFTFMFLFSIGSLLADSFGRVATVGFNFHKPTIDLFFVNTKTIAVLTVVLIILTVAIMMSGRYMTNRKITFTRDMFYFITLYGFIAPWWLLKSIYNTALSRKTSWR